MKFLAIPRLQTLSSLLSSVDGGDQIFHSRVEAYSCKPAGADKRLGKQLERQLNEELATSPSLSPVSPLGPLTDVSTRKLLIALITTMNASFPDYDFSNLRAEQFEREAPDTAMNIINNTFLNRIDNQQPGVRTEFWLAVNESIQVDVCEIYSWSPDVDHDIQAAEGVSKLHNLSEYGRGIEEVDDIEMIYSASSADEEYDVEDYDDYESPSLSSLASTSMNRDASGSVASVTQLFSQIGETEVVWNECEVENDEKTKQKERSSKIKDLGNYAASSGVGEERKVRRKRRDILKSASNPLAGAQEKKKQRRRRKKVILDKVASPILTPNINMTVNNKAISNNIIGLPSTYTTSSSSSSSLSSSTDSSSAGRSIFSLNSALLSQSPIITIVPINDQKSIIRDSLNTPILLANLSEKTSA